MHPEEVNNWYKIAESLEDLCLPENNLTVVDVKGKKICISHYQNRLFAFAATCPHAGGNLAGGYIDAVGNIVCPLHRYKFAVQSGKNTSGEGYHLKTWPVVQRADGIYIAIKTLV